MAKTAAERFWAKVQKGSTECWNWTGARVPRGYGSFGVGKRPDGSYRITSAHRFSWELYNGPIPEGSHVLHRCDNRVCVNPAHLFLGTNKDNVADRQAKRRHSHGEKHPKAKLTQQDVWEIRRRAAAGEGMRKLARAFGVRHPTIIKIVRHETWSEVDKPE